ncbi:MAG TPA: DUF2723 domain-containing protein [Anaerolineales bacterium]|nr:DUF2723 domain-containing protein [Anaerolineales bacterium]
MLNKKSTVLLVFVLTLAFYIYTLLPSLAWGDGTKLQSEAISGESFVLAEMTSDEFSPDPFLFSRVGVAAWDHPLYIIIGHILVKTFSSVDSLWLVNLISAIFGAASVALVFLLSYRFTESVLASFYASFSLALSHTFWWHSSTPEVYTLFIFLFLISFYWFDQFEKKGGSALLIYSAFFWGLAASTHILAFLAIPALGFYFLLSGSYHGFQLSGVKKLGMPALGFLAGFSLYIIQFVRMSANFPLAEILGPVVGSTFLSQLGTFSPIILGQSLLSYIFFLTVQFNPVGIVLGILGFRKVLDATDLSLRKIISFFAAFALFGIFYRVTDQFTFFIPSYVFWAMLMGIGSDYALKLIPPKSRFLLPIVLGSLLLATPFFYNALPRLAERNRLNDDSIGIPQIGAGVRDGLAYYVNPNKRRDHGAYDFGHSTVLNLPPHSIVIAEWYTDTDEYFILRYFTKIQPLRADVTVIGWATQDPFSFDSQLALDVIEDSIPERPIYLASLSDRFYAASTLIEKYCIIPENNLYRLHPKESRDLQCLGVDAVTE